ncbi:MAG: glycoside hydrolase family 13 protein [Lachnospiraceae bacterium]|nr:alpha-glycosidase [Agathobacter sp.]MDD6291834.1 glycoside hydrolase family 13 protein [Lachnospiraceae bacterium]
MKKEAILHIPLSQYAYAEDECTLVIRLRAAKGDLKTCDVYYGDRVDPKPEIRTWQIRMERVASDDLYDYFEAKIKDRYRRICYYFLLDDEETQIYYCERGFCDTIVCSRTEYFQFPYIRREDIQAVPRWTKNLVMYHIFPDSFASGYRSLTGEGRCTSVKNASGEECRSETKLGGTLRGVRENLDYLSELGINCIYLNPLFAANSYHKYDTIDYFSIDPCFGTLADVKELVQDCHGRGIRVLFDGVFNHCGPDFFAFRDVLKKGRDSKYYNWFYDMPEPIRYEDPPNYEAFAYVKEMPKLNTGNREVEDYLIRVGTYWIQEADIDGWRLDVANEVNHGFWRHFRSAVRQVRPDAFLIGEIWEDSGCWLLGDQFDSTMNYRFSYLCKDFFAERTMSVSEFDAQMIRMIYRYPSPVALAQMNFLDSHDIPRFLSACHGDRRRLELALFYLMTAYGIPSIFYGDEYCIEGVTEQEYRRAMPWETGDSLVIKLRDWITLRKSHSALCTGSYRSVRCRDKDGIYVFLREDETERVLVLLNNSDAEFSCRDSFWQDIEKQIDGSVENREKQIEAMTGMVIAITEYSPDGTQSLS